MFLKTSRGSRPDTSWGPGLLLHRGIADDCLNATWCPWKTPIKIHSFLIDFPFPRRKCLGALALSKTKHTVLIAALHGSWSLPWCPLKCSYNTETLQLPDSGAFYRGENISVPFHNRKHQAWRGMVFFPSFSSHFLSIFDLSLFSGSYFWNFPHRRTQWKPLSRWMGTGWIRLTCSRSICSQI